MSTKKTAGAAKSAAETQSKAVETAAESVVAASQEVTESMVKAGSDAATKQYEQAVAKTQEQVEKTSNAMFKGYDEFSAINKQNLDAMVKSSTIFAKGFETISKEFFSYTQSALEMNVSGTKALLGAKSLKDVVDLQSEMARKSFDSALAESAKLTEMSVEVTNKAFKPLQDQVNVTVEKMTKPLAA
ncbi:MAG: phasin family protein [Rhodovibrionaceae bacterium]